MPVIIFGGHMAVYGETRELLSSSKQCCSATREIRRKADQRHAINKLPLRLPELNVNIPAPFC